MPAALHCYIVRLEIYTAIFSESFNGKHKCFHENSKRSQVQTSHKIAQEAERHTGPSCEVKEPVSKIFDAGRSALDSHSTSRVGFGRIVASERAVPSLVVNPVQSGSMVVSTTMRPNPTVELLRKETGAWKWRHQVSSGTW